MAETEMNRPDHQIHEVGIPNQDHAHLDQKHHKGMRAPIAARLPQTEGQEGY